MLMHNRRKDAVKKQSNEMSEREAIQKKRAAEKKAGTYKSRDELKKERLKNGNVNEAKAKPGQQEKTTADGLEVIR